MLAVLWLEAAAWLAIVGMRLREWMGVSTADARIAVDAATAAGVFLVVRLWSIRGDEMPTPLHGHWWERLARRLSGVKAIRAIERNGRAPQLDYARYGQAGRLKGFQGFGRGILAAAIFWLGPALSARGWSSLAEAWPVAAFVFAALFASHELWFATGLALGAGITLNPQFAWFAPTFVLWPLFMNAPRATARVIVGGVTAVALASSRELIGGGALWVAGATLAPLLLRRDWPGRFGRPLLSAWVAIPVAIELLCWPLILPEARHWPVIVALGSVAILVLTAGLGLAGRRWIACQTGLAAAAALVACPLIFGGSYDALAQLFHGASHDRTSRIAALIERFAHLAPTRELWRIDLPAFYVNHAVTVAELLLIGYGLIVILAAAGAARRSGRGDPGTLVALALPLIAACGLVGAGGESVAWAACATTLWVAAGAGMTAWHILLASGVVVLMGQAAGWM